MDRRADGSFPSGPGARLLLLLLLLLPVSAAAAAPSRLDIRGDYLIYSYDYNYLYGRGHIQGSGPGFKIAADDVHLDMAARLAVFSGGCRLESGDGPRPADVAEFDLQANVWTLIRYGERQERQQLSPPPAGPPEAAKPPAEETRSAPFTPRTLGQLQASLLYYLNRRVLIRHDFKLTGYSTTMYVEGIQSFSFRRIQLIRGDTRLSERGLALDRLWFSTRLGIVADGHLSHDGRLGRIPWTSRTTTNVQYDILRRNRPDPPLRTTIDSETRLELSSRSTLSVRGNYISRNLFVAGLTFNQQWTPAFQTRFTLEHRSPFQSPSEEWLRLESGWRLGRFHQMALRANLETQSQYDAELSGSGRIVRNLTYSWRGAATRLRFGDQADRRLQDADMDVSFQSGLFTLSGQTSFHRDLINQQQQVDPRLTLRITPMRFYGGLLSLNLFSVLQYSRLSRPGFSNDEYKADISALMESEPLPLARNTELSVSLQGEQFFNNTRSGDVTSLGAVWRLRQGLFRFLRFEFAYTYHTRRQNQGGFLAGTASQEWTAQLKLDERIKRLAGWVSLTCDTRTGRVTTGYVDLTARLVGSWYLQTQFNRDFLFRQSSANIYLSRRAGRIMVRASYRTLSRQFVIEILPG